MQYTCSDFLSMIAFALYNTLVGGAPLENDDLVTLSDALNQAGLEVLPKSNNQEESHNCIDVVVVLPSATVPDTCTASKFRIAIDLKVISLHHIQWSEYREVFASKNVNKPELSADLGPVQEEAAGSADMGPVSPEQKQAALSFLHSFENLLELKCHFADRSTGFLPVEQLHDSVLAGINAKPDLDGTGGFVVGSDSDYSGNESDADKSLFARARKASAQFAVSIIAFPGLTANRFSIKADFVPEIR